MSISRRRRLEALERRQIHSPVWTDPFPSVMRLWDDLQAVAAGKAEWIPRPERERTEDEQDTFERQVREYDRMHARLTAKPPEAA
jgi:hypothetical protein